MFTFSVHIINTVRISRTTPSWKNKCSQIAGGTPQGTGGTENRKTKNTISFLIDEIYTIELCIFVDEIYTIELYIFVDEIYTIEFLHQYSILRRLAKS